jgi:hypothetical protein
MRQHQIPHPSQPIEYALWLDPKIFLFFFMRIQARGQSMGFWRWREPHGNQFFTPEVF